MRTFQDWINEGQTIYAGSLDEFHSIETQIEALEQQLAVKRDEVNQIAHVIGKPPIEQSARRISAEIIDADHDRTHAIPIGSMARALTGRHAMAR